ncbi:MAG: SH3 domain-containing protein [Sedimentisphaerales bacterium]
MESYLRFSIIVLVCGLCLPVIGAQPGNTDPMSAAPAAEANALNLPAFPFLAEITGDDVYVRSGPGTQYYNCGKARKDEKVKVVGNKFSWLQIVAPTGSYSWISKQYVQIDPQNNTSGTVIGEAVRVYAGSDEVQPMHSTSMQVKLNKGDKVTIVGEEKDGYCKIAPPEGAYLWVSSQHAKPLGTLMAPAQTPTSVMPTTAHPVPATPFPTNSGSLKPQVSSPNEPNTPSPTPVVTIEEQRMSQVQVLKAKVEAERAKPAADQNFADIKKELMDVAGDKQSPKAARSAAGLLNKIKNSELSLDVAKAEQVQDDQLGKTLQKIEGAKNEQLSKLVDKSIFAAVGKLLESPLFAETPGAKYYRVVDENGKTLCYARPTGAAADVDLSKFVDKKVGLVGTTEANTELGGAVVQFTNIVEVQ